MEKTAIELFAGVGGFRVGLNRIEMFDQETGRAIENDEWDFVWANQWEPSTKQQDAFLCYTTRFGMDNVNNTDISLLDKTIIPDHNLLVGGFPCQDYSVARSKSKEKGIEGKKGVLFWEIAKTLSQKKTPFFLLENVDRLLKSPASQRGRDFGIMIRTLTDLGYNMEWRVINAADYGRGQRRRRVFIFGWKNHLDYNNFIIQHTPGEIIENEGLFANSFKISKINIDKISVNNILDFADTVEMTDKYAFRFENTGVVLDGKIHTVKTDPIKEDAITIRDNLDLSERVVNFIIPEERLKKFNYLRGNKKIKRRRPNGEVYYYTEGSMSKYDDIDLPARTMLTSERSTNRSTHIIMDPNINKMRFITPIEAERFQDFPDDWTNTGMSESKRYFMMGNALVTGLVSRMETRLSEIFEVETQE